MSKRLGSLLSFALIVSAAGAAMPAALAQGGAVVHVRSGHAYFSQATVHLGDVYTYCSQDESRPSKFRHLVDAVGAHIDVTGHSNLYVAVPRRENMKDREWLGGKLQDTERAVTGHQVFKFAIRKADGGVQLSMEGIEFLSEGIAGEYPLGGKPDFVEIRAAGASTIELKRPPDVRPPTLKSVFCRASAIFYQTKSKSLSVASNPPGAAILMDGKETRFKTNMVLALPNSMGEVFIAVRQKGYATAARSLRLEKDKESVSLDLVAIPPAR